MNQFSLILTGFLLITLIACSRSESPPDDLKVLPGMFHSQNTLFKL